jgi:redox-sensing transcriptional repressor
MPDGVTGNISSAIIASALGMNDVQVRKDLAVVSNKGRPKLGYVTKDLVADLEHFLGYDSNSDAVLAGVGNLGKALLFYENFEKYGLNIVAAFDIEPGLMGTKVGKVPVLDSADISLVCRRMNLRVGIITAPAHCAQMICDKMLMGGVLAIWNFAPVNLRVPADIVLRNEDMAASLAVITKQLENLPIQCEGMM